MPLYEYRCTSCGNEFEVIQKFSDKPVSECQECSGPVEKLISRSSFHLKGSGWYATDYGGKGEKGEKREKGEKEEKPCGEKKAGDKPDCSSCPSA